MHQPRLTQPAVSRLAARRVLPLLSLWRMLCLSLVVWCFTGLGWAQSSLQAVPALTAQVIDETGTLSAAERQQITRKLEAIEHQYGSQVVVLMVDTTQPEEIAGYANRVASAWNIGRKDAGDGLLFIIAKNDRSLRLEVARGLEGTIPDIVAGRIIQNNVVPLMRNGDFAAAIEAGLEGIESRLAGDEFLPAPKAAPAAASSGGSSVFSEGMFAALFFGVPVVCNALRRLIGRVLTMLLVSGGVGVGTFVVTQSWGETLFFGFVAGLIALGASGASGGRLAGGVGGFGSMGSGRSTRSGGGWSSGGGGGFRSGGGGSFGGGGASGKW